jgi:tRNA dimethylallyltransferase
MGNSLTSHPGRRILVLVGPTASGKTPISLLIAQQLPVEIISADSRQVYKFMDIGTAKPSVGDLNMVKHYFVDELPPDHNFNAGEFGKKGREVIDDIFRRKKIPLVVGGSGLYVQALIDGFFEGPAADPIIRESLYKRLKNEGAETLLSDLRTVDPVGASGMLPTNTRRIVRALEVYQLTATPISKLQQAAVDINFQCCMVGLEWSRKNLYDRINARAEWMVSQGLLDEVRRLRELGFSSSLNALQTVGYKEVFEYLDEKISYHRMVELIKQNSRRYAKRQLTWFRRDERIRWFNVTDENYFPDVAGQIVQYFSTKRDY